MQASNGHSIACLHPAVYDDTQKIYARLVAVRSSRVQVPGFYDAIRSYVLHSISITFRKVSKQVLGDWLRLEGASLQQLIAEKVC